MVCLFVATPATGAAICCCVVGNAGVTLPYSLLATLAGLTGWVPTEEARDVWRRNCAAWRRSIGFGKTRSSGGASASKRISSGIVSTLHHIV